MCQLDKRMCLEEDFLMKMSITEEDSQNSKS